MNDLLKRTLQKNAPVQSDARRRALSMINDASNRDKKAKVDFNKRQLAVKALQARMK